MLRVTNDIEMLVDRVDDAKREAGTVRGLLKTLTRRAPAAPQVLDVQERHIDAEASHQGGGEDAVQASGEEGEGPLAGRGGRGSMVQLTVLHTGFTSLPDDGSEIT